VLDDMSAQEHHPAREQPHDWLRPGGRLTNLDGGEMIADLVMVGVANPAPREQP
jgi:hypothetical protein